MRTVNSARNPAWANHSQTLIDLEVDFDELDEVYVPFTADPNDPEEWGRNLYQQALNGDFGDVADWTPPDNITGDKALNSLRGWRDSELAKTDYIEMPTKWATLSAEKQAEWSVYRNALRDMPQDYPNVEMHWNEDYSGTNWVNVTFPTKPE